MPRADRFATDRALRPGRLRELAAAGAAGAAALIYVGVRNPHNPGVLMPVCPIHWATGLDCPGCGGLRMTHDLLRGDVAGAFRDNAVLLVLSPLLAFLVLRAARRWARADPSAPPAPTGAFELNGKLGVALGFVGLAWMVVRNIRGW
jgi:hypothetical protein